MTDRNTASLFAFLLLGAALLLSVPLVLGFLGRLHPALDSFAHFRAHIAVIMALLALPLFFTALWREAAMVLVLSVTAFATTLGVTQGFLSGASAARAAEKGEALYSLLQLNLRYNNREPAEVLRLIGRERPDIITLEEASPQWEPTLKLLEAGYPYRQYCRNGTNAWSVGILSRRPFAEDGQSGCVGDGSMAFARFDLGGAPVTVVALHLGWPWPFDQPQDIALIFPHLAQMEGPLLIAGDFNAVPWSNAVRRIETASGTHRASGIGPTYAPFALPAGLRPYIGLPIDQILTSPAVRIAKIATLRAVGSDHLPVRLDFAISQPARENAEEAQIVMN
ncbi:endonuclease/exonuclease/phosphatase family protein [Phyllobacterium leguminum]|uniref:Endonuclease/exonuclease/phosphatase (EEP) superfamily protein YafD n=1 Tax=Phyllobacterium leguminum TaxID=314237 RepID=A0A318T200_9HYPH|nr:endonuclease/exonuclease/phosphatase family protein [Phyllobacterium leguminum]PYE88430.1 endonuclease/exonuclease/phosphatase (EEP) superfamily protein YafD [Phyllobacterium leguminum]